MTRHSPSYHAPALAAGLVVTLAAGCSSPLQRETTASLRQSIIDATGRELSRPRTRPDPVTLTRSPGAVEFPPDRTAELTAMAGPTAYPGALPPLDADLLGEPTTPFRIDLRQAIARAATHNLAVQSARLDPAISESQFVAADAAFDWVFFATTQWNSIDQPQIAPVIGGVPVGVNSRVSQSVGWTTGLRKRTTTGGLVSLTQTYTYADNKTQGLSVFPDPAQTVSLALEIQQPLLRGAGSDVALAEVRLASNTERRSIQLLKTSLLTSLTETERAYWRLAQAQRNLHILQRLLERGVETRDILKSRLSFDVKPAEFSDAVATVERRQANVIRASNTLRQASDQLKLLINDPELTVGSEALLLAADDAIDQPIGFSLLDSLTRALTLRPEIQEAILAIDDASIRRTLADNARLPLLDLTLRTTFNGLSESIDKAFEDIGEAQFVDYFVQLAFEQPIGNRAAEAGYRGAQLARLRSVLAYRDAVRNTIFEIKAALRDLGTNYKLIEQTRSARLAAAENLRTLLVQEQTVQSLNPTFLDLKLRRQENLATAEQEEIQALVDYNIALADYHRAVGDTLERNRINFVVPDAGQLLDP